MVSEEKNQTKENQTNQKNRKHYLLGIRSMPPEHGKGT